MCSIPRAAEPLIQEFAVAFTRPTLARFVVLLPAAIPATGRRTVTNLLPTVSAPAPGHPSSYHRVFSKRRWSSWRLARALAGFILRRWVPQGPVRLCGDDTVDGHRGKKVYGKACHRDAVRRCLWVPWVFATPRNHHGFAKLPRPFRDVLLYALAPAA